MYSPMFLASVRPRKVTSQDGVCADTPRERIRSHTNTRSRFIRKPPTLEFVADARTISRDLTLGCGRRRGRARARPGLADLQGPPVPCSDKRGHGDTHHRLRLADRSADRNDADADRSLYGPPIGGHHRPCPHRRAHGCARTRGLRRSGRSGDDRRDVGHDRIERIANRGTQAWLLLRADRDRESTRRQSLGLAAPTRGSTMTVTGRAAADRESKMRPRVSPKPTAKTDFLVLGIAAALATIVLGAQQTPSTPFTAAQAGSSRVLYDARCASCHQQDLRGAGEAPSLSGAGFRSRWLTRSPEELTAYVQAAMPPTGARLNGVDAINVSAFLITTNRTLSGAPAPAVPAPPPATVAAKPSPKRGLTVFGH